MRGTQRAEPPRARRRRGRGLGGGGRNRQTCAERDSLQRPGHVDCEMLLGYTVFLNARKSAARRHPSLHCWGSRPGSFSPGHLTAELTPPPPFLARIRGA